MPEKSLTFADFNPTGDVREAAIKAKTDEMIAFIDEYRVLFGGEGQRRAALAVTNYEQAAMRAVKALFW